MITEFTNYFIELQVLHSQLLKLYSFVTSRINKQTRRLYIIGNGFDLFHGVKSSYFNFKEYVQQNDRELFEVLEEYFNTDELWSDFEETLAYIDTDTILEDANNFLESYGAEDWSEASHHDYQYEIKRAIDTITVTLQNHFTNWILQLRKPLSPQIVLYHKSTYINFNYTDTLESTYAIPKERILYIHNKAIDIHSTLILGHSRPFLPENSFARNNDEDTDVRIAQGNDLLDEYFRDTYKNTEVVINENKAFFESLNSFNEVYVLGHSISEVDIRYFEKVNEVLQDRAKWKVSYYSDEQRMHHLKKLSGIGINENNINLIKLDSLRLWK